MMRAKDNRYKFILKIALVCIFLDQITKLFIVSTIPLHDGFPVISGLFNIVHVQNYGAAFGFLNDPQTNWQFWFFVVITICVIGFILNLVKHSNYDKLLFLGFGLILGGAIGNFLDRVRFRYVIDFLDFYINTWHWPVFNVADVCICIGTACVAWVYYFEKEEKQLTNKDER